MFNNRGGSREEIFVNTSCTGDDAYWGGVARGGVWDARNNGG